MTPRERAAVENLLAACQKVQRAFPTPAMTPEKVEVPRAWMMTKAQDFALDALSNAQSEVEMLLSEKRFA